MHLTASSRCSRAATTMRPGTAETISSSSPGSRQSSCTNPVGSRTASDLPHFETLTPAPATVELAINATRVRPRERALGRNR